MARRRKRHGFRTMLIVLVLFLGGGGIYYRTFVEPIHEAPPPSQVAAEPQPQPRPAVPQRPEGLLAAESPTNDLATSSKAPSTQSVGPGPGVDAAPGLALMRAGIALLTRGNVLEARGKLSEALAVGLPASESSEARGHLARLADQTVFGSAITPNDPLVVVHVIAEGETLAKIAKQYAITSDLLARINGIKDKHRIRAGQRLKVIQGPFTAVVHNASFDMDVLVGNTVVKHFRVGLGTDGSTPPGKWKVHNKLMNPTYYPPRGGAILAADDPKNPLGERWIGLVGLEGEAVGQQRYGIHGTIEPESIGKNMSLGCVRLLNSDVELLFEMLVEEQSTVTIK